MIYLIADSGSSKTDWAIVSHQGLQEQFQTIGINPYFWTYEQIQEEIWANVAPHVSELEVEQIFFYGAGCSNAEKKQVVASALHKVFPNAHIVVEHDLLAAARALCGKTAGIACILGTGSNACVFDGSQITAQPINLGFWLGDEGSGGYIGKKLLKAFLHQELPEELYQKLKENYLIDIADVLENAYQKPFPNRYFASFAPFALQNAEHPFIQSLLYKGFEDFLSKYVAKLPNVETLPIHFVGSIAVVFEGLLRECLQKRKWQLGKILKIPMEGLIKYHTSNGYHSP
ncbi:MAG: N-acetylglucosamine kinase [Raineya sp.]|nr:N-acetylglucosamine kinase [Raineya sp.]